MKVLAVDDNQTNLHILQVFLKKLGHQVLLANNGEEALNVFRAESPDLILLDIMMPVMDGFEAARRIKQLSAERWIPIILLSALSRDDNLVSGLNAGADDYLTKPINFVVLEAKIRSVERTLSLQQQLIETMQREQAISDNIIDALLTMDDFGIIASINHATEKVFGWQPSELIGQHVSVLLPPKMRRTYQHYIDRHQSFLPEELLGSTRELRAARKDGSLIKVSVGITEVSLDKKKIFIGLVRDISEAKRTEAQLKKNAALLQAYYDQTQSEQQLAIRLMEKQLHRDGLKDACLSYSVIPAENFSGDIVAAARSPEGNFYALLADATGHGLSAAISVLPVLALFYRLSKQNCSVLEIVQELNQQLKESIPLGRFVAATIICLNKKDQRGEIWVGGAPEALLFDRVGQVEARFPSRALPLGIVDDEEMIGLPVCFSWNGHSQLILCSDGLLEATSADEVQFGQEPILKIARDFPAHQRFQAIEDALKLHINNGPAQDDISLMVINCHQ